MGILRILLALSVVIEHSHTGLFGIHMVGGRLAVQAFFIISGFYMALILSTKYTGKGTYSLFLSNRLMRIYPAYWAMLAFIIATSLATLLLMSQGGKLNFYIENFRFYSLPSYLYVVFVNIFIFGLDTLNFIGVNRGTGNFYFTSDWQHNEPKVSNMTLNGPAWTISLELFFYLIAPFLNKFKLIVLIAIALVSISIKVYLFHIGLDKFPWGHAFFPAEFFLFIAGIIAYRIYDVIKLKVFNAYLLSGIFIFILIITVVYSNIEVIIPYFNWIYLSLFFLSIPCIFILTKKSRLDLKIGEFSYPIYICHIFLIFLIKQGFDRIHLSKVIFTPVVIICVLGFSYLMIRFITEPIEKLRQARVKIRTQPQHIN